MMFKKTLLAAAVFALGGVAFTASAASPATNQFNVTLTINSACTVTNPNNVAFVSADASSKTDLAANNAAAFSVTCSKNTPYTIGLKPSNGNLLGAGAMKGTTGNNDTIAYTLFQDASSTVWGDTVSTNRKSGTTDLVGNVAKTYAVYAKVLGTNLNVTPDSYSDAVTVSVYY